MDLEIVISEMVQGTRETLREFQPKERMPYNILEGCKERESERNEKLRKEQHNSKYHDNDPRGAYNNPRYQRLLCHAVTLGLWQKAGKITNEDRIRMCDELVECYENGTRPEWLDA